MCYGCYKEYGEPAIINARTQAAAKLADAVYEFNCVGGNCHIVLDDFNIEDSHIDWCLDEGLKTNIHDHDNEQLEIEKNCLIAFKVLTVKERASALAIHQGWI